MADQIQVNFKCLNCGGTVIELPDDHTDDSIAKCKSCKTELGRWGDIKAKAADVAADAYGKKFRDIFKGPKNWTVK